MFAFCQQDNNMTYEIISVHFINKYDENLETDLTLNGLSSFNAD